MLGEALLPGYLTRVVDLYSEELGHMKKFEVSEEQR